MSEGPVAAVALGCPPHHWIIPKPDGSQYLLGRCQKCGETKEFAAEGKLLARSPGAFHARVQRPQAKPRLAPRGSTSQGEPEKPRRKVGRQRAAGGTVMTCEVCGTQKYRPPSVVRRINASPTGFHCSRKCVQEDKALLDLRVRKSREARQGKKEFVMKTKGQPRDSSQVHKILLEALVHISSEKKECEKKKGIAEERLAALDETEEKLKAALATYANHARPGGTV